MVNYKQCHQSGSSKESVNFWTTDVSLSQWRFRQTISGSVGRAGCPRIKGLVVQIPPPTSPSSCPLGETFGPRWLPMGRPALHGSSPPLVCEWVNEKPLDSTWRRRGGVQCSPFIPEAPAGPVQYSSLLSSDNKMRRNWEMEHHRNTSVNRTSWSSVSMWTAWCWGQLNCHWMTTFGGCWLVHYRQLMVLAVVHLDG